MRALLAAVAFLLVAAGPALAHPPWGLVVDAEDRVYFSDLQGIWRIDAQGRLTLMRRGHTHELAIDAQGGVHGEESTYDPSTGEYRVGVWRMSPSGRVRYLVGPVVGPPRGSSIWRDRAGRTYYVGNLRGSTETLLFRRERDGRVTRLLGSREAAAAYRQELTGIHGAAIFGPDGAFYFHHGGVLRKVGLDGRVVTLARDLPERSFGLAVEPGGAVLLAHFGGRRVLRFAPDGRRSVAATAEPPWAPTGVAVSGGALYLLEGRQDARGVTTGLRVRKVPSRGRPVTLATVPVR